MLKFCTLILRTSKPWDILISGVRNKEVFLQCYGYRVNMLQICAMILRTTQLRETLISGVWWNKEVFPQGYVHRVYMLQFCTMIPRQKNMGYFNFWRMEQISISSRLCTQGLYVTVLCNDSEDNKTTGYLISGVWNKEVFAQDYGYRVYMLQFCAMILKTTQPRDTLISGVWWNKEVFLQGYGHRVYMLHFCA